MQNDRQLAHLRNLLPAFNLLNAGRAQHSLSQLYLDRLTVMSEQTPPQSSTGAPGGADETTATAAAPSASSPDAQPQPEASQPSGPSGSDSAAAAIRAQVEAEQALADAQRRVKELEDEVSRVNGEKRTVEGERDSACERASCFDGRAKLTR
jgi:hypothetical protein